MQLPRINAIGIVETPSDHIARPRSYSARLRVVALVALGVFAVVSVATTVFSLGAYCLTSYAGSPFAGSVP